jgi:hypothetical protein
MAEACCFPSHSDKSLEIQREFRSLGVSCATQSSVLHELRLAVCYLLYIKQMHAFIFHNRDLPFP